MEHSLVTKQIASFSSYGKTFQEKTIQALFIDPQWAEQMSEIISPTYFDVTYLKFIAEKFFAFYGKYRSIPAIDTMITIVGDELKVGNELILKKQIIDFFTRVQSSPDVSDFEYVKEKSHEFCKKQAMRAALEKSVELIAQDNLDGVMSIMKDAINAGVTPSIGHDYFNDVEARFEKKMRIAIPTGIDELDQQKILNGGLARRELGVIVAPTGVGKSHFLVQMGATAMKRGKNVLHYTFELAEESIAARYDAHLAGIPSDEVIDRKEEVLRSLSIQHLGRLIVKEYPTGAAGVNTIRAHIDKLALKQFVPNIIIIDYADIMRSSRQFDSLRHELKLVYEELRGLAAELQIPIWTASQSNKEGASSEVVGLENMSEAYGKAMIADVVLTLQRRGHEKASGLGRLFVAKNRAGRDGMVFPIRIDTSTSTISIIDESEVAAIEEFNVSDEKLMKRALKQRWNELSRDSELNVNEVL